MDASGVSNMRRNAVHRLLAAKRTPNRQIDLLCSGMNPEIYVEIRATKKCSYQRPDNQEIV